ncbi:MAG: HPr kinase/phosphorylase [Syntrophaceae bacterium PtaU1.Bin231]|nr:MAG: HPr kinase/phosphorylase [Syntrophaceae bacterium PtaU1.Bin231]HOG17705.1 hypothetical protein [Syntrophales bacterium]
MSRHFLRDLFHSRWDRHLLKSRLKALIDEKCRHRLSMHGALVLASGVGTLIVGKSGAGKTTCAVDLARRGHKWIADDIVVIERKGGLLVGSGHPRIRGLLALDGRILDAQGFLGADAVREDASIAMMIELGAAFPESGMAGRGRRILGRSVPCWRLPATITRSGAVAAVEALAQNLRNAGEGM